MGGRDLRSDKSNCTVDDFPLHPSEPWLPCATVPSLYVNIQYNLEVPLRSSASYRETSLCLQRHSEEGLLVW